MLTTFKDHLRLHVGLDEDRIDRLSAAMEHIGSGDGIPVLPTTEYAGTARQIRTAPL